MTTLETQKSPLKAPPPTEFPYPAQSQPNDVPSNEGSDSTLVTARSVDNGASGKDSLLGHLSAGPSRPAWISQKFDTERPRLRIPAISQPGIKRWATGTPAYEREHWMHQDAAGLSSDSSSDSSEEEPDQDFPGLRQLNSAKRKHSGQQRDSYNKVQIGNDQFQSKAKVSRADGRLKVSIKDTAKSGYLAKALDATIHHHLKITDKHAEEAPPRKPSKFRNLPPPKLSVLIAIIGSRGDIQPFIRIAKILQEDYGHRIRFATHPAFKDFVEKECGLEFFSLGGDPSELMAFMVKNPGLIPSIDTIKKGEVNRRRVQMLEMFEGFWRACISATNDEKDAKNTKLLGSRFPFVADAIIANPPSFAHYHCAERLGIPLHLMFTFPYSPTQAFPHPLANIKRSDVDPGYANFMSYPLVELMTWQGLGDLVNRFRTKTLGLEEVSTLWAPGQLYRMKVPYTYLWSPGLVPKPKDWGPEIDIAGYVFLDLAASYQPPESLTKFLDAGETIYIGFGSISGIDDPKAFTNMLFEATKLAGVRALISKGWGGVGADNAPDNVYMIDNIPHDWLFPRMHAVVHHGGAGTTAAGLRYGKPTLIVPFFGDQPFWAQMITNAGAGGSIPYRALTAENLAEGIIECLRPEVKVRAQELAASIEKEGDGAKNAVQSFHRALPLTGEDSIRCDIFNDRVAVWQVKRSKAKLSAQAADLLVDMEQIAWSDLELLRTRKWTDFQGPGEPVTGASGALVNSLAEAISGVSRIPFQAKKDIKASQLRRGRRFWHIGTGAVLPEQIGQDGANQQLPRGGHVEDGTSDISQLNLTSTTDNAPRRLRKLKNDQRPRSLSGTIMMSTANGVGHSAKALASLPVNVGYALARGFHNAPRLYGDDTVRQTKAIRGLQSSLIATRDELGHGVVDGVSGLVTLPYQEVQRDGLVGVATGLSKGVGGFVLKPLAGVLAIPTYFGKGVQMELHKRFRDTEKTDRYIRRARMIEGALDVQDIVKGASGTAAAADAPGDVRRQAEERWRELQRIQAADEAHHVSRRSVSALRRRSRSSREET